MIAFTEKVLCPICQSSEFHILRPDSYEKISESDSMAIYSASSDHKLYDQLVRCNVCDLVYLNPRVKQNLIIDSYKNAIDPTFINQNEQRIMTFESNLKWLLEKFEIKSSKDIKVLDIGCAGGAFPKATQNLGLSVIGIEPSIWLSEYARSTYNLDVRTGVLSDHEFEKKNFDIVTMWDVIEHLTDPSIVLEVIEKIIKDDGLFVINYPNYNSVARKILGMKWPFFLSVHLFYFSPSTIEKMLIKNGFEVIHSRPYWQTLKLGYVLKRAAAYFSFFKIAEKIIKKLSFEEMPLKYNMGQTLLVAKKVRKK